ncbi:MAG: DUF6629 family protein [Hyphomicrobiaceae bacterium]
MCFSATASFTVAAALTPVAAFSLATARRDPRWLALAAYPLAFGLQQAIEGILWLGLEASDPSTVAMASRGFVFFSHFFWPAWVPFSVYRLESTAEPWRRRMLLAFTIVGFLFGLSISLPSLMLDNWLLVEVVDGSIEYRTVLVYDAVVGRMVMKAVYAVLVVSALLLSTERVVQIFGGIIVASLLVAQFHFAHAFVSVWCFFAAVLSLYVGVMMALRVEPSPRAA